MLKTQLGSKIHALNPKWRNIEDILTGDFFGALDYLPREPYLREFISHIGTLNTPVRAPAITDVDWNTVTLLFWPRISTDEESAEPDIVIISNKWVLVIEVKLESGLGNTQPWREYVVGQKIANEQSLPSSSVYYLIIARTRLDISQLFTSLDAHKLSELLPRTSYVKWHEVVSLVEFWLRNLSTRNPLQAPHNGRLLSDLLSALKRRRAIAFAGFAFSNLALVGRASANLFCPPRFSGFLGNALNTPRTPHPFFLSRDFAPFVSNCPSVKHVDEAVFLDILFPGFLQRCPVVRHCLTGIFFSVEFNGFLTNAKPSAKTVHLFMKGDRQ